ncbi:MAG: FKBP-type peptidyl-prolyl cis-trans isomerase [Gallionellaceae bacterium]
MINTKTVMSLGALFSALFFCSAVAAPETSPSPAPSPIPRIEPVKEMVTTDTVIGTGAEAVSGKTVTVQYTGWLYNYFKHDHKGEKFDTSVGRGPFSFPLGVNRVIKGWDQGIAGMKVGGKRTLIVPADLAYGSRGFGRGAVPPGSPLVFDIELVDVK